MAIRISVAPEDAWQQRAAWLSRHLVADLHDRPVFLHQAVPVLRQHDHLLVFELEIRELVESMAISGGEKQKRANLKKLKSKGSYAALMRAMRSENANIRIQAARILRRSGVKSKAFTKALIGVVRSDPDKDVRGMIAEVLVYYDNRETVPALIDVLLHDGGDGARTNAARALAAIKDGRSVTPLINALDDKDTWVRLRAAGALKRMGAKRAVPALVERLNDPNKRVQERAHQALRALTGRSMGPDYATWRKAYPAR